MRLRLGPRSRWRKLLPHCLWLWQLLPGREVLRVNISWYELFYGSMLALFGASYYDVSCWSSNFVSGCGRYCASGRLSGRSILERLRSLHLACGGRLWLSFFFVCLLAGLQFHAGYSMVGLRGRRLLEIAKQDGCGW
jgi:hypothetical protein